MCGIAGFFGKGTEEIVHRMTDALSYRGPDDAGYFFDGRVGLGQRRLSIIDVSERGRQPMWNEDHTIAVVFNGELYNFRDLKNELIKAGHTFISDTDTEVLVHGYEEWGNEVFTRVEGMCACALYDVREERLLLVRDRFGKKPLYYYSSDATVAFGSELKAVLVHPEVPRVLNHEAVNYYMMYEYVPHPYSIYKDVHAVSPATIVEFQKGMRVGETLYWSLPETTARHMNVEQVHRTFETLLSAAVKKRLMSDVPLGIFLSGGIDSSSVAYYAQRHSATPVHTFSIGFKEDSFDESNYARMVARHIGSDHHEEIVSVSDALNVVPTLYSSLDEPLGDASLIPTYILSQMARKSVTVALGGDGSDELLYGYPTFYAHTIAQKMRIMPEFLRRGFFSLLSAVPVSESYFSIGFKLHHFMKGWEYPTYLQEQIWRGSFGPRERARLFTRDFYENVRDKEGFGPMASFGGKGNTMLATISRMYCGTYLPDDILVKVDRASMFNSLEVRAPFLDQALAEFIMQLPDEYKLHGRTGKWLLKKVMKGKIPDEIINRPKKGFALPIALWLRTELKSLGDHYFGEEYLRRQGIFNPEYVWVMWDAHQTKKRDYRKELWTLLAFQLWYDRVGV